MSPTRWEVGFHDRQSPSRERRSPIGGFEGGVGDQHRLPVVFTKFGHPLGGAPGGTETLGETEHLHGLRFDGRFPPDVHPPGVLPRGFPHQFGAGRAAEVANYSI